MMGLFEGGAATPAGLVCSGCDTRHNYSPCTGHAQQKVNPPHWLDLVQAYSPLLSPQKPTWPGQPPHSSQHQGNLVQLLATISSK